MSGRTIAIGDIHGCARALNGLLEAIAPTSDDTLVALGDYVDRGEESREVLERLLRLESTCRLVPLIGNHELMMVCAFADYTQAFYWLENGGQQTLDSYGGSPGDVPDSHHEFLQRCQPFFETDDHLFLHANYDPDLDLREQPENLLYWTHLTMYVPPPHKTGKRAIVGHTPQRSGEVLDLEHVVCIDTYCFGDRWLTALDTGSGQIWQVNKQGVLRNGD